MNKPVDTAHQIKIGFLLGAALSAATAVRTAVQRITSFHTGCALSGAMFFIVLFAVAFGTYSAAFREYENAICICFMQRMRTTLAFSTVV